MILINLAKKSCIDCKRELVLTAFHPHRRARDGRASRCVKCNRAHVKRWEAGHRTAANAMRQRYAKALRARVLLRFGRECSECGFLDERALQIDHVHNDGARERRPNGPGTSPVGRVTILQRALKDVDGRYQLLCANCHAIKSWQTNEVRIMAAKGSAS